ncbi:MAG: hypothetical protein KKH98_04475 [Spirochaetes bacterium]|nr:hypothetical protein [Spirochaetota bacterium]
MRSNRSMGIILIMTAVLVILGLLINYHILWLAIDIIVILCCMIIGIILVKKK